MNNDRIHTIDLDEMDRRLRAGSAQKRVKEAVETDLQSIDKAYPKAMEVLEEEEAIDAMSFANFDQASVKADLDYVERMERTFADQAATSIHLRDVKKFGTVLEAIILQQTDMNAWLGSNVSARRASPYDDIKNGVDAIASFDLEVGQAHMALAIDVTYGSPDAKLKRIREEIDRGVLTEVKYFESADGNFRGSLSRVPRVIVGADKHATAQLAELWADSQTKQGSLKDHPIQLQILDQIEMQLKAFLEYAKTKQFPEIVSIFEQQLVLVQRVIIEKLELYKRTTPIYKNDEVFKAIKAGLGIFKV